VSQIGALLHRLGSGEGAKITKGRRVLWALCQPGGEMLAILTAVFALSVALVTASCLAVSKSAGQDDYDHYPVTGGSA